MNQNLLMFSALCFHQKRLVSLFSNISEIVKVASILCSSTKFYEKSTDCGSKPVPQRKLNKK